MINFYKNSGGVGTIQFASGEVVTLSDDVSIRADNTTNLIIISEFNKDKFWISTAGQLQVNGVAITGTNQQKVDLIAPVFAEVAGDGGGNTGELLLTPTQSFASNSEAVAAIGVGKLYQSTTLINGSPIILITQ